MGKQAMGNMAYNQVGDSAEKPRNALHCTALHCTALHCTALDSQRSIPFAHHSEAAQVRAPCSELRLSSALQAAECHGVASRLPSPRRSAPLSSACRAPFVEAVHPISSSILTPCPSLCFVPHPSVSASLPSSPLSYPAWTLSSTSSSTLRDRSLPLAPLSW